MFRLSDWENIESDEEPGDDESHEIASQSLEVRGKRINEKKKGSSASRCDIGKVIDHSTTQKKGPRARQTRLARYQTVSDEDRCLPDVSDGYTQKEHTLDAGQPKASPSGHRREKCTPGASGKESSQKRRHVSPTYATRKWQCKPTGRTVIHSTSARTTTT